MTELVMFARIVLWTAFFIVLISFIEWVLEP